MSACPGANTFFFFPSRRHGNILARNQTCSRSRLSLSKERLIGAPKYSMGSPSVHPLQSPCVFTLVFTQQVQIAAETPWVDTEVSRARSVIFMHEVLTLHTVREEASGVRTFVSPRECGLHFQSYSGNRRDSPILPSARAFSSAARRRRLLQEINLWRKKETQTRTKLPGFLCAHELVRACVCVRAPSRA